MGQKIHAVAHRLGINQSWKSKWFNPYLSNVNNYSNILHQDLLIHQYLKTLLKRYKIFIDIPKISRVNNNTFIKVIFFNLKNPLRPFYIITRKKKQKYSSFIKKNSKQFTYKDLIKSKIIKQTKKARLIKYKNFIKKFYAKKLLIKKLLLNKTKIVNSLKNKQIKPRVKGLKKVLYAKIVKLKLERKYFIEKLKSNTTPKLNFKTQFKFNAFKFNTYFSNQLKRISKLNKQLDIYSTPTASNNKLIRKLTLLVQKLTVKNTRMKQRLNYRLFIKKVANKRVKLNLKHKLKKRFKFIQSKFLKCFIKNKFIIKKNSLTRLKLKIQKIKIKNTKLKIKQILDKQLKQARSFKNYYKSYKKFRNISRKKRFVSKRRQFQSFKRTSKYDRRLRKLKRRIKFKKLFFSYLLIKTLNRTQRKNNLRSMIMTRYFRNYLHHQLLLRSLNLKKYSSRYTLPSILEEKKSLRNWFKRTAKTNIRTFKFFKLKNKSKLKTLKKKRKFLKNKTKKKGLNRRYFKHLQLRTVYKNFYFKYVLYLFNKKKLYKKHLSTLNKFSPNFRLKFKIGRNDIFKFKLKRIKSLNLVKKVNNKIQTQYNRSIKTTLKPLGATHFAHNIFKIENPRYSKKLVKNIKARKKKFKLRKRFRRYKLIRLRFKHIINFIVQHLSFITGTNVSIKFIPTIVYRKRPMYNSNILGQYIVYKIQKKKTYVAGLFKSIIRTTKILLYRQKLKTFLPVQLLGLRLQFSGRMGRRGRAVIKHARIGRIPLQSFKSKINYCLNTSLTKFGVSGIKVWIHLNRRIKFRTLNVKAAFNRKLSLKKLYKLKLKSLKLKKLHIRLKPSLNKKLNTNLKLKTVIKPTILNTSNVLVKPKTKSPSLKKIINKTPVKNKKPIKQLLVKDSVDNLNLKSNKNEKKTKQQFLPFYKSSYSQVLTNLSALFGKINKE